LKVAFTIWGNRISPVFDSARKLFIVGIEGNKIISTQYELFETGIDSDLAEMLTSLGINVLVCGAISKKFSNIIETSEIKLIPFISGHVDEVLASYLRNNEISTDFFMPGCRNQYYRQINGCKGFISMPGSTGTGPKCKGRGQGGGRGRKSR
jgi:predicted Fe-Mo cluster-binding NifX family protein